MVLPTYLLILLMMLGCTLCVLLVIIGLRCFILLGSAEARVVQQEVDALEEIARTMGSKYWKFDAESCVVEMAGITSVPPTTAEHSVACKCNDGNSSDCHVVRIVLKGLNLPGVLPPQLVKLPYLQEIDFAYNYLNGTIPREWASTQLTSISLLVNRLSGKIPKELENISTLTYLCLEANQFSGSVPPELGKLTNLQTLMLSSNQLTGYLPTSFAGLINLTDFRINDNNFNGTIPSFFQNWKKLDRLEMVASGLTGPIPSTITVLNNLIDLRISDINGPRQSFPNLSNITRIEKLVLRNCNIFGELPTYLWRMQSLDTLDVSFNKLSGRLPSTVTADRLRFIILTHNLLTGSLPDSLFKQGSTLDLSYNNFFLQEPEQTACRGNLNLNLNLYRSSNAANSSERSLPCIKVLSCPKYSNCLHINSGGKDITIKENKTTFFYQGDVQVEGGAAKYFLDDRSYWGFSSTGDFMDDYDSQNTRFTVSLESSDLPELYSTARKAPISLTYFHYCLENGKYTVNLHFAEIQFTNDRTYNSLGRRMFDIYIQERLVWKDFNIEDEAGGARKPLVKQTRNVTVTNYLLEIRFSFAGKGTTRIPLRGVYGPLVSAVSVVSDFKPCSVDKKKERAAYIIGGVVGALGLVFIIQGILWWKGILQWKKGKRKKFIVFVDSQLTIPSTQKSSMSWTDSDDLPSGTFSLKQIRAATGDFDPVNKIGEGGFGPVYKGLLTDGTVIAVKQLSSKSRQGNREFLNEIGMISCLRHPNLVKLHGFCVEGDQLLLVYEYMENNSLARALYGKENDRLILDWPVRFKICIGVAKGLAFLHESRLKIVHRDIKATNVLLDGDLTPKISDFGLARLDEAEKSHISTRIAGTIGYMAPEYALWGYLTDKADVYSFGVLALEIVSGKNNSSYMPSDDSVCLLDWACQLQQNGNFMEIVDETLRSEVNRREAEIMIKVGLLCTNASPTQRPTMSEVVSMLEGLVPIPDTIPEPSNYTEDLRFKAMRDLRKHEQSISGSQTLNSATIHTFSSSYASEKDLFEINDESKS